MTVTDEYLANNEAYASTFNGPLPLPPSKHVAVMAIGGFTGSDHSPTLTQFQQYVADNQVRYFIAGDRGGPPPGKSGSASDITAWVQQNFTPIDVGGTTVYDLSESSGR